MARKKDKDQLGDDLDQEGWAVLSNRSPVVLAVYDLDERDLADQHSTNLKDEDGKYWTRVSPWFNSGGSRGQ